MKTDRVCLFWIGRLVQKSVFTSKLFLFTILPIIEIEVYLFLSYLVKD